jgi:hypothetical protein
VHDPAHDILPVLAEFLVSLAVFLLIAGWLYWRYRAADVALREITPRRGLVCMLSTYKHFGKRDGSDKPTLADLRTAIAEAGSNPAALEKLIRESNWAPPRRSIAAHRAALECCWIVCTPEAGEQFEDTCRALDILEPGNIRYYSVSIPNSWNIRTAKPVFDKLFAETVPALVRDDVIADITSGTAAMSAALVLSAVDKDIDVQYLNQDSQELVAIQTARELLD